MRGHAPSEIQEKFAIDPARHGFVDLTISAGQLPNFRQTRHPNKICYNQLCENHKMRGHYATL